MGNVTLHIFFRGMEPEFPEKKNMAYKCKILHVYSKELFFIGGDLGVHNQCTMADGENVYYRGEGICNLVLATEKVIILFFNE